MSFSFLSPWWSVLLLLLPLLWFRRRQLRHAWLPWVRSLVAALLVLALMQPVWVSQQATSKQVVIVDLSESVGSQGVARAKVLFEHWQQQHGALSPEVIMVTHRSVMPEGFTEFNTQGVQHADTISDAMQQAAALIPNNASGEVTLISDGMATDQHWQTTVAHLAARGIPLSVLALPAQQTHAVIADVAVQPWYHGQQFQAEVNILGADNAKSGNELRLVLRQQGRELARVEGINNQQALVSIKAALPDNEINTLELALMDGATIVSQKTLALGRQAPLSLLYVSTHPEQLNALATLLGSGFTITSVTPTALHDVADLAQFTAVIMDDVASEQLPLPQQQRLLTAVNEQGVGLLYAGGQNAFAKKDLSQPLQQSLPLIADPQQQIKDPSVALAIIIDSSGSMEGEPISLAKKIARLAVRKLQPSDQIGIVEFYGNKQWAVPMQPVAKSADIERAIGRIQASGSTVLYPAIEEAYYGLKQAKTRFKHMLVISDAGVEEENYQQLLRAISQDGINVSTLLVGGSGMGEDKMQELANWGQGRFYVINDEFSLVELDFHLPQPQPQANRQAGQFDVRNSAAQNLQLPAINGYSKTKLQTDARLLLSVANGATAQPTPFYASWPVGRGEIAALSSALFGPGLQNWQQWDGYGSWLATQIRRVAHTSAAFSSLINRNGDELTLWLKRNTALPDNNSAMLTLMPKGESTQYLTAPVVAEQVAPAWYRAQFSYPHASNLYLEIANDKQPWYVTDIAASDRLAESEVPLSKQMPLAYIAAATGGVFLPAQADIASLPKLAESETNWQAVAMTRWLVLLALLLYLFEVLLRRWPLAARQSGVRKSA